MAIDLDALVNADRLPKVRLFGREMTVHPLSGAAAHRIAITQDKDETGAGMLGALIDVMAVVLPDVTKAERERLSVEQLTAVLQLARGQVAEVEAQVAAQLADGTEKN